MAELNKSTVLACNFRISQSHVDRSILLHGKYQNQNHAISTSVSRTYFCACPWRYYARHRIVPPYTLQGPPKCLPNNQRPPKTPQSCQLTNNRPRGRTLSPFLKSNSPQRCFSRGLSLRGFLLLWSSRSKSSVSSQVSSTRPPAFLHWQDYGRLKQVANTTWQTARRRASSGRPSSSPRIRSRHISRQKQ